MTNLQKIIKGCKKANRRAQKTFFKMYYGKLSGIAQRYAGESEANNLTQDVFLIAYESFPTYINGENDSLIISWLKEIMIKHYIMQSQINGKFKENQNDLIEDEYKHPITGIKLDIPTDIEIIKKDFQINDIMWAINMLDDENRLIFNLVAIDCYSIDKIAKLLDIECQSVNYRYNKAKNKVKFYIYYKDLFCE